MNCHLIPIRMAVITDLRNSKCRQGYGKKGNSYALLAGCKLVQPLWKTVWRGLRKLKIGLPYDPAVLLGVYLKETKILTQKDICIFSSL